MEQACPALINSSGREAGHGGEASGREEEKEGYQGKHRRLVLKQEAKLFLGKPRFVLIT